jgi:hypothetical protein
MGLGLHEIGQRRLPDAKERFEESTRIAPEGIEDFFVEKRGHSLCVYCRWCAGGAPQKKRP